MRIEYLSNHPATMKEKAVANYQQATLIEAKSYAAFMQARRDEQQVHQAKRWWQKLVPAPTAAEQATELAVAETRITWHEAQQEQRRLAIEARRWSAGVDGEQSFDRSLESLSDDWLLFSGYRNDRGEADKVLLGPGGLWVVEVKNINGWLHVAGKHWIHESLDARALPVRRKATDAKGRSWGEQVNGVARGLDLHLQRNGIVVPVRTAVVLTHPEALIVQNRNADVDFVGRPVAMLHTINNQPLPMASESSLAVANLIRQQHERHDKGGPRQGAPGDDKRKG